jgi:hypothetical protein
MGAPKEFPRGTIVGKVSRTHILDTVLLWTFIAVFSVLIVKIGDAFERTALESLMLALILPFELHPVPKTPS